MQSQHKRQSFSCLIFAIFVATPIFSGGVFSTTAQPQVNSSRVFPEIWEENTYQTLKKMIAANIQTLHDCEKKIMERIRQAEELPDGLTEEDKRVFALDAINRQVSCINLILENLKQKRDSLSLEDRRRNEIVILLHWAKTFFKEKKEVLKFLQENYGIWPEPVLTSPRRSSV